MAKTDLTAARLREVLHYDSDTGLFTWLVARSRTKIGALAGYLHEGYVIIGIDGQKYKAHRLAWLFVHGEWPATDLDHKDTIKSHNWIKNLRPISKSGNGQNRRLAYKNSTSKTLGVSWHKKRRRWVANIVTEGRQKHIGYFKRKADASTAYKTAKRMLHNFSTI